MNVKGASGAGKSTIRPLQRELAGRLGISWKDFALISPDYWRKYLFDYRSLGEDFKYGAMLTGQELEIIDKKLDRYMELKAMRREMPHLLIDRFRFDSFSPTSSTQSDGRLLSRFGATVFLFFVITPPTETVERAWKRGIETGRYKAVDDLLYHNIEAYTGMPQLFFSWVNKERQKIHFEFLDNDVPYGQRPRTAAFGWNHQITILDVDCMRRLNRYTNINVEAKKPSEVFLPETGPPEDMLLECIENVPVVTVADPVTLKVKAQYRDGQCVYGSDIELLQEGKNTDHPAPSASPVASSKGSPECTIDLEFERKFIIGVSGLNEQGRSQKQNS
ncbi:MAG: ATP-binding protein [Paracoccaceae bacterium]|nr:ATP-binding protein [Paracoccaceae bacterium]